MRFLGIGEENALGDMYLRLAASGHEVKVFVGDPASAGPMRGWLSFVTDWKAELAWLKEAGRDGIAIFETANMGEIQDDLRRDGFPVIGGGAFGDRLELDRAFGQQALRDAGLQTAASHTFRGFSAGVDFIDRHPGRYVLKLNGSGFSSGRNYVGELEDGRDMKALLVQQSAVWREPEPPHFILMEHVSGVEIGVGGYFNGERFLDAVCVDWEHKRFFDGDRGELTGEMGTLVSYRHGQPMFAATLAKMADQLRAAHYVGYINVNTIVNARGIWPLEFTARFGYPGFAVLDALHKEGWHDLFARMIGRRETHFRTYPGFAVGVVLTVPPFPRTDRYEQLSKGLPILFRETLSDEDRRNLHLNEVELRDGVMMTSGEIGYLMTATGRGSTVEAARDNAYALAQKIVVPNLRYRTDIGERFLNRDRETLRGLGLWPEAEDETVRK